MKSEMEIDYSLKDSRKTLIKGLQITVLWGGGTSQLMFLLRGFHHSRSETNAEIRGDRIFGHFVFFDKFTGRFCSTNKILHLSMLEISVETHRFSTMQQSRAQCVM
jgi:hypothetical protein